MQKQIAICLVALLVLAAVPVTVTAKPSKSVDTKLTISAPETAEVGTFTIDVALTNEGNKVVGMVYVYKVAGKGRDLVMTLVGSGSTNTNGAYSVLVCESAEGTYSYIAKFYGDETYEDAQSKAVQVTIVPSSNTPPTADFDWDQETPSSPFVLFNSWSNDPDGTIVLWTWDYGDGTTEAGSERYPAHYFPHESGVHEYTVTLTVRDDDGAEYTVSHLVPVTYSPY